ncbi:YpbF family protein [Robertmurraya massiliosenegalensis]|uniref:YpbF family protein n=1 Tax=Robertmurraya massiliosenegalensis TaxID=1287657 RepID=UPI0003098338|nr:YpbF family protein [Robertmurraya massiliosenegalensis]
METSIKMLDDRTDKATKQMLQKVVERKRKFDAFTFRHFVVIWLTVFSSFIYLFILYKTLMIPYSYSFAAMFSAFVDHSYNLYALVIIVGLYGLMNLLKEKKDKAEKEYHALRCEIIDKSKDLWKPEEAWKNRHLVFEMMKKNYDINLYHENK